MPTTDGGRGVPALALRWHALALAVVLVALVPIVGTNGQFSADEGAVVAQATRLARGDGWTMAHPFPAADPSGEAFPFELSSRRGDEYAPFAKHAVYAVVLAGVKKVAGNLGMVLLSIAGTVVAALLAGHLVRSLDRSLGAAALWAVGLASPLFFDGYVLIAHTLAAACAAGAVLCVWRVIDGRGAGRDVVLLFLAVAAGTLLRTEMPFFAFGLAVGAAVVARTGHQRILWRVVVTPVAAAVVAYACDALLLRAIMGGAAPTTAAVASTSGGAVGGRILAFVITWLLPSYSLGAGAAVLLVGVIAAVIAANLAATKPGERDGIRLFAVVAAGAVIVRLALGPDPVPGLLMALPLLPAGVVAARRRSAGSFSPLARLAVIASSVFAVAVLATQYGSGGSGEWGGRYFALALPVIVPVLLVWVRDAVRNLDHDTARIATAGFAVMALALSALAVVTLRHYHRESVHLSSTIDATARANPARDGGSPVVVAADGAAARFAFTVVDHTRFLTVRDTALASYADRLADLHVGTITFVTRDASDAQALDARFEFAFALHPGGDWIVAVFHARAP